MASPSTLRTGFGAAAYHDFDRDDFEPRPHYAPLWEQIRRAGQSLLSEKGRKAHWTLQSSGSDRLRLNRHHQLRLPPPGSR